jgi:hypothetical protein
LDGGASVSGFADDFHIRLRVQEMAKALANGFVIFGDDDTNHL